MPTSQPRVTAVVEEPLFEAIETLARRDGVSLSQKVRDLLVEALELWEDAALELLVERRRRVTRRRYTLTQARRRLGVK